jgi:hypothetical protein
LQVLQGISRQYPNLFGIGSNEPIEENSTNSGQTFESKWGWIVAINNLANNDRSKWSYYEDMNIIEFLNTLVFYKDKSEDDKLKWQQAQRT